MPIDYFGILFTIFTVFFIGLLVIYFVFSLIIDELNAERLTQNGALIIRAAAILLFLLILFYVMVVEPLKESHNAFTFSNIISTLDADIGLIFILILPLILFILITAPIPSDFIGNYFENHHNIEIIVNYIAGIVCTVYLLSAYTLTICAIGPWASNSPSPYCQLQTHWNPQYPIPYFGLQGKPLNWTISIARGAEIPKWYQLTYIIVPNPLLNPINSPVRISYIWSNFIHNFAMLGTSPLMAQIITTIIGIGGFLTTLDYLLIKIPRWLRKKTAKGE